MPELPDVVRLQHFLEETSLDREILKVEVPDERILHETSPQALGLRLTGGALCGTSRRGKFLFARSDGDHHLVLHFGMTGDLVAGAGEVLPEYTKLVLRFPQDAFLAYTCRRMLGKVAVTHDIQAFCQEQELGPDALDEDFSSEDFRDIFSGRTSAVKSALMNQSLVAGIGNVYADEILFQASLAPTSTLDELGDAELEKLYRVMRRVLRIAARHEGHIDELPGHYLLPHRDRDEHCPECEKDLAETNVAGRTTRYCPACQST